MRLEGFSQQLRRGFEELRTEAIAQLEEELAAEPVLAGLSLQALHERVRDPALPVRAQDETWAAIVRRYRLSRNPSWAVVVLELLAPALIEVAAGFATWSPVVDVEDLHQQIALETLAAFRAAPLDRVRFVKPWVVLEVRRRVGRWLAREARQPAGTGFDDEAHVAADATGAAWELCELSNQRSQDLVLLYRLDVLGESLEDVARETGCTANAVNVQRWRARQRLQREFGLAPAKARGTTKDRQRTGRPEHFGRLAG